MQFKFNLTQPVTIAASGETGEVIGRAEYTHSENNYYIRYRATDGRAVEAWWPESALRGLPARSAAPLLRRVPGEAVPD